MSPQQQWKHLSPESFVTCTDMGQPPWGWTGLQLHVVGRAEMFVMPVMGTQL